ncbi:hypothetical protein SynSYN20_00552 [Synechococcus sp. SYN20]|nr:hypothetical protein SynSYN20_00552 [Synechococcus sp. SYN20]
MHQEALLFCLRKNLGDHGQQDDADRDGDPFALHPGRNGGHGFQMGEESKEPSLAS